MTTWHEVLEADGALPPWPYPLAYGKERLEQTDVLVIGGGIAGCFAASPHELARAAECHSLLTVGEAVIQASLARRVSSAMLNFHRLDQPELDPSAWQKLILIQKMDPEVLAGELPLDYHLRPPYAGTFEDNYRQH